jgi:hypothetical protein
LEGLQGHDPIDLLLAFHAYPLEVPLGFHLLPNVIGLIRNGDAGRSRLQAASA